MHPLCPDRRRHPVCLGANVYDQLGLGDNIDRDVPAAVDGGAIYNTGKLTMTSSIVSDNSASNDGGGVANNGGTLTVTGSTFTGNRAVGSASSEGGGLYNNAGKLSVTDSTLSANSAQNHGGGIYNNGTLTMTSSTLSGNSTQNGGGGIFNRSSMTVSNSTFSGNHAQFDGGDLRNLGTSTVTNSTFSGNSVVTQNFGAGIHNDTLLTLNNTILANSIKGVDLRILGTVTGSNNVVMTRDRLGGLTDTLSIDPKLGPLADNGGPTKTHALLPGSPAIDAGNPAFDPDDPDGDPMTDDALPYDQRGSGFTRIIGNAVDIGAFERQTAQLAGDYNRNGTVDAADYTVWRNTLGSTIDLRADGSGPTFGVPDGVVDEHDYAFWKANYGNIWQPGGGSIATVSAPSAIARAGAVGNRLAGAASSLDDDGRLNSSVADPLTTEARQALHERVWSGIALAPHSLRTTQSGNPLVASSRKPSVTPSDRHDDALLVWLAAWDGPSRTSGSQAAMNAWQDEEAAETPFGKSDALNIWNGSLGGPAGDRRDVRGAELGHHG